MKESNNLIIEFHNGLSLDSHQLFGSHFVNENGIDGVRFTVYAPNAKSVEIIGEFNDWDGLNHIMEKVTDGGIYSLFVENIQESALYKYRIETFDHQIVDKADPYAFFSEVSPGTASRTYKMEGYFWQDTSWMNYRTRCFDKPVSIYEVNIGSWRMKQEATEDSKAEYYTYSEMVDLLIPYVKQNHYTHIELMPLTEFPFEGSWGYQVTGYFSATSRYGDPKQLMYFIDRCHQEGIGVIIDYVPAHYVKDAHGLYLFDGGCVYDYQDYNRRYSEWGTVYFDLESEEVRSFLMSSCSFWADYYHVDGIRFDAVSNLVFWRGNKQLGENKGAIAFLKRLNFLLHERYASLMTIAEDSSDFPNVTKPTDENGLGFDYKWDLGWMNDTLRYLEKDPIYRKYHHNFITFSMAYFYSEKFILPFSHDEVVHGKKTIIDKIHGSFEDKFAQLKTLYMYMFTHPGKKLNFMGNELAEFKEWDEKKELGWSILKYPTHDAFYHYFHKLNQIYRLYPSLSQLDYKQEGFKWMIVDNKEQSVLAYVRTDKKGKDMVVVLNFTPNIHTNFRIPVKSHGVYKEIVNSDQDIYGGNNLLNQGLIESVYESELQEEQYISVNVGSFGSSLFELVEKKRIPRKVEVKEKTIVQAKKLK